MTRHVQIKVILDGNANGKGLLLQEIKETNQNWQPANLADKTLRQALDLNPGLDRLRWATCYHDLDNVWHNDAHITVSQKGTISPEGVIYHANVQLESNHLEPYIVKFDNNICFRVWPKDGITGLNNVSWDVGVMVMGKGNKSNPLVEHWFLTVNWVDNLTEKSVIVDKGPFATFYQAMCYGEILAQKKLGVDDPMNFNRNRSFDNMNSVMLNYPLRVNGA